MRLHRTHEADLEVRSDGRTVHGIAVPYNDPTTIRDWSGSYVEIFAPGAFAKTISERGHKVKALAQHNRQALPLGRATALREDAAGLYCELRMSKTREADEVLELIRDGAVDSFSVGFAPVKNQERTDPSQGRIVTRTEARLDEISVVPFPAYAGAEIAGVRALSPFAPNPVQPLYQRLHLLALEG